MRAVELELAGAWIAGIIRRRTRICTDFSFRVAAIELTFFLVMDPGMVSSRRIVSCF